VLAQDRPDLPLIPHQRPHEAGMLGRKCAP
jgi:hypothetical protein